jgi:hypothetical protein
MRAALTAAVVLLLASASATSGSIGSTDLGGDKPPRISWADAKHRYGWVVTTVPPHRRYCSRDGSVLCATDDGGKHWRTIFHGSNHIFGYLRWSKNAGVIGAGAYSHGELWTRDGGRHWWGTRAFQLGGYEDYNTGFGAGPRFFVGRGARGGRQLRYAYAPQWPYRVLNWFPTRPLSCAGQWTRSDGFERGPKNICGLGPVGGDRFRSMPAGPTARLTAVVDAVAGEGLVRSSPLGIDCGLLMRPNAAPYVGTSCSAPLWLGSTVVLRALVTVRPQTVQWTGCDRVHPLYAGIPPVCEVTLAGDTQVTATIRVGDR